VKRPYHYTESGLDSVYLLNGYRFVASRRGRGVVIQDVDGLHMAIGSNLVTSKKRLSGSEFRFLRTELLLSQASLARLLQVRELTVARWEKGQTRIPLTADATIRVLYEEHVGGRNQKLSDLLESLAELDDVPDRIMMEETNEGWSRAA